MTSPRQTKHEIDHDVLIIGSGAAGLTLALKLAMHCRVAVLSKVAVNQGSTYYAQGGISAVLAESDSIESHINDTLDAGAGLCDPEAVRFTVENGRAAVEWLLDIGVAFTHQPQEQNPSDDSANTLGLHLTREGGHSHRRVAHADDSTGKAIETTLIDQTRNHPQISLFEGHVAIDLITSSSNGSNKGSSSEIEKRCIGAYVLNRETQQVEVFRARFVILASGGASKVYLYTSNPDISTGDGIAMAWRAGCRISNMEFMQFHPTCLYHPHAKSFLVTEAVRGEGGRLLLPDGERFMQRFDERAELAPRDIVARAIDHEMKRLGVDSVFLDISHRSKEFILQHFPTVSARCQKFGYDMTQEPLPVVPAAHYTSGGVMTDLHARTDLDGLYAVGEVACTGLHGANRMASNSLLECIVFAKAAAEDIIPRLQETVESTPIPPWDASQVTDSDERIVVNHNWDELRRFMWDYVGIVRTTKRLQRAQHRVELLKQEIHEYYAHFTVTPDLIELRNLVLVAELIIESAIGRKESRGLHFTRDYPEPDPQLTGVSTVLAPE